MKQNMGTIDRALRIIFGAVILAAGVYNQSYWGLLGIVLVLTAFIRWCPLYLPFGIKTCAKGNC